ncbi:MAG: FkbM family methyltransferase [Bryobacteraceae bacterium]
MRRIADLAQNEAFTLIDIGCSGGIGPGWRMFGGKLRAFGFEPSLEECARLARAEQNPAVQYIPRFVGLRADHPFARKKASSPHSGRNPWKRLSVCRTLHIRNKEIETMPVDEKMRLNEWRQTPLADPSQPVYLPEFFAENWVNDIDFIKLDVDGPDFEILHSLETVLADARVLGLDMEVNFNGTSAETDHTFHNTDRFMRSHGFDLFNLTVRRYSAAALPSRYVLDAPAQSELGRLLQGDALYVRDICNPEFSGFAARLTPEKILKTAAIFAIFNLPDCAAEVLVNFRERVAGICNADSLLDCLAAQMQHGADRPLSYKEYVAAFERNRDLFYQRKNPVGRTPAPPVTLRSRIRRVLQGLISR